MASEVLYNMDEKRGAKSGVLREGGGKGESCLCVQPAPEGPWEGQAGAWCCGPGKQGKEEEMEKGETEKKAVKVKEKKEGKRGGKGGKEVKKGIEGKREGRERREEERRRDVETKKRKASGKEEGERKSWSHTALGGPGS